jgi:hypothetical protein
MGDSPVDCARLSSYRGDPGVLFAACCPGQPAPSPAAADASISSCPNLGAATAAVKRVSENAVTCTYAPSPLWAAQQLPEGSAGRAQACAFLSAAASGTPSGGSALVHLSGESAEAPAFLARWRGFGPLSAASPPEEDAACESAAEALRPAFERFVAARLRAEAGRLLPGLASEQRQPGVLYPDHEAWASDWPGQLGRWQARLQGDLVDAARALGAARAVALATCFPIEPPGAAAARTGHVGAFGRTMAELLTAGLDQGEGQLRPERVSAEDPALNGEGAVMCAALPALVMRGLQESASDPDPGWWKDAAAVRACYRDVAPAEAARLAALLDGPDPRVLDAFRLVRGWVPDTEASANCGPRVAALHRALHTLAVFYHGSSFFRVAAGGAEAFPETCRMTEAERREPWHRGAAEPTSTACPVGVSSLCAALPNGMYARPGALGHGVLRGMVMPELLDGSLLSVKGTPSEDNELNVALARALAAHKQSICEREQWAGVRADEFGTITESPNFCRRDLSAPWLFSTDPGRGACGRALAMVRDTPLAQALDNFPFGRRGDDPPYCPTTSTAATRNDAACCCDVSHYAAGVQVCTLSGSGQ